MLHDHLHARVSAAGSWLKKNGLERLQLFQLAVIMDNISAAEPAALLLLAWFLCSALSVARARWGLTTDLVAAEVTCLLLIVCVVCLMFLLQMLYAAKASQHGSNKSISSN